MAERIVSDVLFEIHKIGGGVSMTRSQVAQKNVLLFIPGKVSKICAELARTEKLSLTESILKFYNSPVYETLSRESSKLWQEDWVYIYQVMREG